MRVLGNPLWSCERMLGGLTRSSKDVCEAAGERREGSCCAYCISRPYTRYLECLTLSWHMLRRKARSSCPAKILWRHSSWSGHGQGPPEGSRGGVGRGAGGGSSVGEGVAGLIMSTEHWFDFLGTFFIIQFYVP